MADIRMYGAPWCPDCRRSKKFLGEHRAQYDWIDIDDDAEGLRFVEELQGGGHTRSRPSSSPTAASCWSRQTRSSRASSGSTWRRSAASTISRSSAAAQPASPPRSTPRARASTASWSTPRRSAARQGHRVDRQLPRLPGGYRRRRAGRSLHSAGRALRCRDALGGFGQRAAQRCGRRGYLAVAEHRPGDLRPRRPDRDRLLVPEARGPRRGRADRVGRPLLRDLRRPLLPGRRGAAGDRRRQLWPRGRAVSLPVRRQGADRGARTAAQGLATAPGEGAQPPQVRDPHQHRGAGAEGRGRQAHRGARATARRARSTSGTRRAPSSSSASPPTRASSMGRSSSTSGASSRRTPTSRRRCPPSSLPAMSVAAPRSSSARPAARASPRCSRSVSTCGSTVT